MNKKWLIVTIIAAILIILFIALKPDKPNEVEQDVSKDSSIREENIRDEVTELGVGD